GLRADAVGRGLVQPHRAAPRWFRLHGTHAIGPGNGRKIIVKQQIIHVSKLQAAKVAAVLYLILSIPLAAVMVFAPKNGGTALGWGVFFLVMVVYVLAGAVFSFLGA